MRKPFPFLPLFTLVVILLNPGPLFSEPMQKIFITRDGSRLMEGDREFRFLGLAAPNLHQNEGQLAGDWSNRFPDEFEIRDSLATIRQMGGRATRCFSLSIRNPSDSGVPVHVEGIDQYGDEAFQAMDLLLALCHEYDVRLILPLIDSHSFWGWRGVDDFAAFRDKPGTDFWTDNQLKEDFRRLIHSLLHRRNTITGILYKDDPAILAWQTGNELSSYVWDRGLDEETWMPKVTAWTLEMAEYIQSLDENHLVMEGGGNREAYLKDPNIDVISAHYYEYWNKKFGKPYDLAAISSHDIAGIAGLKPVIADELGMAETDNLQALLDEIVSNGTAGGLLWGIRAHRRDGGFYYHNENGTKFNSYHWPGFTNGETYDERKVLKLLREKAYAIRNMQVPPMPPPEGAPLLLPIRSPSEIMWRGCTGAASYDVERSSDGESNWSVVASGVEDVVIPGPEVPRYEHSGQSAPIPIFADPDAPKGEVSHYRVRGRNDAGLTPWSNVRTVYVLE